MTGKHLVITLVQIKLEKKCVHSFNLSLIDPIFDHLLIIMLVFITFSQKNIHHVCPGCSKYKYLRTMQNGRVLRKFKINIHGMHKKLTLKKLYDINILVQADVVPWLVDAKIRTIENIIISRLLGKLTGRRKFVNF